MNLLIYQQNNINDCEIGCANNIRSNTLFLELAIMKVFKYTKSNFLCLRRAE